jgi:hypothetical protein
MTRLEASIRHLEDPRQPVVIYSFSHDLSAASESGITISSLSIYLGNDDHGMSENITGHIRVIEYTRTKKLPYRGGLTGTRIPRHRPAAHGSPHRGGVCHFRSMQQPPNRRDPCRQPVDTRVSF